MQVTITASQTSALKLKSVDLPLETLAEYLTRFEEGPKDGDAIIPAIFSNCPAMCRNHKKATKLDCDGDHPHRLNSNVTHMTGLGLDLDKLVPGQLEKALDRLRARGIAFFWWNTYRHTPEKPKARILIPFATPMPLKMVSQWRSLAYPNLLQFLDLPVSEDKACSDPARVYFLPRKPPGDTTPRGAAYVPGKLFDWRPLLEASLSAIALSLENVPPRKPADPTRLVSLEEIRKALKRIAKPHLEPLIKNVLKGLPPTPPPEGRPDDLLARREAWKHVTAALAAVAKDEDPSEALLEVLRPAWEAEVKESPDDYTEFYKIEELLESARDNMPEIRAAKEGERNARTKFQNDRLEEHAQAAAGTPNESVDAPPIPVLPDAAADDWKEKLQWIEKDGNRKLATTMRNLKVILTHSPPWRGALRYNTFTQTYEVHSGPLHAGGAPRPMEDVDAVDTCLWLASFPDFGGVAFNKTSVQDVLESVVRAHRYNPLQNYLNSVKWDGTPRIESWLETYLGAKTIDDGVDITLYIRAAAKRWLIAAVARGLRPGCKADDVLVLEGLTGKGKSTAFAILGGDFFSDASIDIHSKDAQQLLATVWIAELAELDSLRKSENSTQKAFFSRCVDKYRPSYGRFTITVPRQCVFGGTTNKHEYLTDETGNRRYWSVACGDVDLAGLRRDRDQLFAEAVHMFKAGEQWHMTPEERIIQVQQAEQRMEKNLTLEKIEDWFLRKPPGEKRPVTITMLQICEEILEEPAVRGNTTKIGQAVTRAGFVKRRRAPSEGRAPYYEVPRWLLDAPTREPISPKSGRRLTVVEGGGEQ